MNFRSILIVNSEEEARARTMAKEGVEMGRSGKRMTNITISSVELLENGKWQITGTHDIVDGD